MKPKTTKELWQIAIYRIKAFNSMTKTSTPKLYKPRFPPRKDDLLRVRNDFDSIIREYDVIDENCSFRYNITTRYLLETLSEEHSDLRD
jgi:hypothetical protein